jgi:predicted enzyme related to lactoylglutathione lyase
MKKALTFYTQALGLTLGRRFDDDWVELRGGSCVLDLLGKKSGSQPFPLAGSGRDYRRHWTPVHLDFVVEDIDAAVQRAQAAGAKLEKDIEEKIYGRLALMSDPFGHGFCFLEFRGGGYDEINKK